MIKFRILFVLDILIMLYLLWQHAQLIPDIMSEYRNNVWPHVFTLMTGLAICILAIWGAFRLKAQGRLGLGSLVLLIPAGLAALLILLDLLIFGLGEHHH